MRRTLQPLRDHRPLQRGDVIDVRVNRLSGEVARMCVVQPGVAWLSPVAGSTEVRPEDLTAGEALQQLWGEPFDALTMYTVLSDMDYAKSSLTYILYFPDAEAQGTLHVYVHRALRQLSGSSFQRGGAWETSVWRCVGPVGPNAVMLTYTEFPAETYSRKSKVQDDVEVGMAALVIDE